MSASDAPQPQRADAPLTRCATFLTLSIRDTPEATKTARSALSSLDDLSKNITMRDLNASFVHAELHPFQAIKGETHTAVSTPGDLLFHIRSERRDLCFEFERQLVNKLGDSATVIDSTSGFRYFDNRDLLGFVDGTANPVGPDVSPSVFVSNEDESHAGGSYIVVQKYLHEMTAWQALSTEQQEGIIGRTKLDNIELDDAVSGQLSHKTLSTIERDGVEYGILRDNMPFGNPGLGEFGTYFIGYSRRLWVIEEMLKRMFIGEPPGLHDRILNFSRPVSGSSFFAPPSSLLAGLDDD
ncbi:MAG: hypothetical protein M1821_003966 [Bathelium mastoideum]|nr:MAG: hypothetical protein M1821_003966 [Bathelium mastoideum]